MEIYPMGTVTAYIQKSLPNIRRLAVKSTFPNQLYFPPDIDSCFFNQSLIASSSAAVCVSSKRAQAISNAIFKSLGILPLTSRVSSVIPAPSPCPGLIFAQYINKNEFALKSDCAIALLAS